MIIQKNVSLEINYFGCEFVKKASFFCDFYLLSVRPVCLM